MLWTYDRGTIRKIEIQPRLRRVPSIVADAFCPACCHHRRDQPSSTPQSLLCLCFAVGSVALVYSMLFRFGQRVRAQSNTRKSGHAFDLKSAVLIAGSLSPILAFLRLLTPVRSGAPPENSTISR